MPHGQELFDTLFKSPPKRSGTAFVGELEEAFLGNAFDRGVRNRQLAVLRELPGQEEAVRKALKDARKDGPQLERLLVAVVHARRKLNSEADDLLPDGLDQKLKVRCKRIGVRAADVDAHISQIRGGSQAISDVRVKVWDACFGADLGAMLYLSAHLRAHNVLILGETGTGKELVARAIGRSTIFNGNPLRKPRRSGKLGKPSTGKPFTARDDLRLVANAPLVDNDAERQPPSQKVTVKTNPEEPIYFARNAAGYTQTLIESELFGHDAGAFTGADYDHVGDIELASGGVFFLDELGELPHSTQAKLLRTIESGRVRRLGSEDDEKEDVDVRYVGATNQDIIGTLGSKDSVLREDFYHRFAGRIIRIPPLRDRPEDIPEIVWHHLRKSRVSTVPKSKAPSDPKLQVPAALIEHDIAIIGWLAQESVRSYRWPGNVRELLSVARDLGLGFKPQLENRVEPQQALELSQTVDRQQQREVVQDPTEGMLEQIRLATAQYHDIPPWYRQHAIKIHGKKSHAARAIGIVPSTFHDRRKGKGKRRGKSGG